MPHWQLPLDIMLQGNLRAELPAWLPLVEMLLRAPWVVGAVLHVTLKVI